MFPHILINHRDTQKAFIGNHMIQTAKSGKSQIVYPHQLIHRFLDAIISGQPIDRQLVNNCHSSINDVQMRQLRSFVEGLQYYFPDTLYQRNGHAEALYFLGFKGRVDSVFFGIEHDEFNDEARIVSLRWWNYPFWEQHHLIFAIDGLEFDYNRDQAIYFDGYVIPSPPKKKKRQRSGTP